MRKYVTLQPICSITNFFRPNVENYTIKTESYIGHRTPLNAALCCSIHFLSAYSLYHKSDANDENNFGRRRIIIESWRGVESASITRDKSQSSPMTTQFLFQPSVALYIFCPCTDSTKNQDQMMRTTWTDGESLIVKIQVESASIITSLGMDNINFEWNTHHTTISHFTTKLL